MTVSQEGRTQKAQSPMLQYEHLEHLGRPPDAKREGSAGRNRKQKKIKNTIPCRFTNVPCYPAGRLPALSWEWRTKDENIRQAKEQSQTPNPAPRSEKKRHRHRNS